MSDLVTRIRQPVDLFQPGGDNERLLIEAADEIERLRGRIAVMRSKIAQALVLIRTR